MSLRASTLTYNTLGINREIDSRYDAVLAVRDKLTEIELVAGMDFAALIAEMEAAQDFTGITVVQGTEVAWDGVNKVLTVPKGDKGDQGPQGTQGVQGIQGLTGPRGADGAQGIQGAMGVEGPRGLTGDTGPQGVAGNDGQDLTVEQIAYNGDGSFTWQFSDGTSYVTPDLRGPQGVAGVQGVKGDQGTGVHHLKGTQTTNSGGDFGIAGETDTYTFYADANEKLPLGWFSITNGISLETIGSLGFMIKSVYDVAGNGVVDNAELVNGLTVETAVPAGAVFTDTVYDDTAVQGHMADSTKHFTQSEISITEAQISDFKSYELADATILKEADIGVSVQGYDVGTVVDAAYVHTDNNFTSVLKTKLDGIEDGATADQTGAEIKTLYEAQADKVLTDVNKIALSLDAGISVAAGEMAWNADEVTMDLGVGTAVVQVGQELLIRIRNGSGSTITNGTVVMAIGSIGNSGRIVVAPHDGTKANADKVVGIMTEDLGNGFDGFATIIGKVRSIDTTGSTVGETWVDGTKLYVKPNDNGRLTMVEPIDSEVKMAVAYVVKAHTNGTLYVRVTGVDANELKEWVNTQIAGKVDESELVALNVFRADKVLATKDVAKLLYSGGNLVKIRYGTDTDVDYEVLTYSGADLVNIAHYIGGVFKGDTVLTYGGGELVSSIFVGV